VATLSTAEYLFESICLLLGVDPNMVNGINAVSGPKKIGRNPLTMSAYCVRGLFCKSAMEAGLRPSEVCKVLQIDKKSVRRYYQSWRKIQCNARDVRRKSLKGEQNAENAETGI
jgi:hypothetical protein